MKKRYKLKESVKEKILEIFTILMFLSVIGMYIFWIEYRLPQLEKHYKEMEGVNK